MFTLTKQTPSSYRCADPVAVATWLIEQGYRAADPRSEHEYQRLRKGNSLIVIYHSGSVLLQGGDTTTPRQLFAERAPAGPLFDEAPF